MEDLDTLTTDGVSGSWRWATVLAVHPALITGVIIGVFLFGLSTTATRAFGLPKFIPLLPGGLMLLFLGLAHLYTPVYVAGFVLNRRRVRTTDATWAPLRLVLLGAGAQIVYFVVPIIQAYGGKTFEELVFGSVEIAALLCTGVVTVRYLAVLDNNFPGAPALVSLWSGAWYRVAQARRFFT